MNARHPLPRARRQASVIVAGALLLGACSGNGDDGEAVSLDRSAPNPGVLPTLAGGVDLAAVDPARFLAAEGLSFGSPLPSEQAAAEGFLVDPEVRAVAARRAYSVATGRVVADVLLLTLDGNEIFDVGVLDAFVGGVVSAIGGAPATEAIVGDRPTLLSTTAERTAQGFREGDLLVVVNGPVADDVGLVVTRQLAAAAAGVVGSLEPVTPLVPLPAEAAFVAVPTVTFQGFPPPESDEPVPEIPGLPGGTGVQGRYGVVAGERRTVVWSFTLDPAAFPSGEALAPALAALASSRAAGAGTTPVEVGGRVVEVAVGGTGQRSATAFRHQGLALLVEGNDPAQVEAVVTAWIAAL